MSDEHRRIYEQSHEYKTREILAEWNKRIAALELELLKISIAQPKLRPILMAFVRGLREEPKTCVGRLYQRVVMEYRLLRLERDAPRARTVSR